MIIAGTGGTPSSLSLGCLLLWLLLLLLLLFGRVIQGRPPYGFLTPGRLGHPHGGISNTDTPGDTGQGRGPAHTGSSALHPSGGRSLDVAFSFLLGGQLLLLLLLLRLFRTGGGNWLFLHQTSSTVLLSMNGRQSRLSWWMLLSAGCCDSPRLTGEATRPINDLFAASNERRSWLGRTHDSLRAASIRAFSGASSGIRHLLRRRRWLLLSFLWQLLVIIWYHYLQSRNSVVGISSFLLEAGRFLLSHHLYLFCSRLWIT